MGNDKVNAANKANARYVTLQARLPTQVSHSSRVFCLATELKRSRFIINRDKDSFPI